MQRFTELRVWKQSHSLALDVYSVTGGFPSDERFGLTAQLRRAATSVAANIAEGSKRVSSRDYGHFLNIAEGSLAEVEELIILSRDLALMPSDRATELLEKADHIARMLSTLRRRVLNSSQGGVSRLTLDAQPMTRRQGG